MGLIHVAAAFIALTAGAIALVAAKGSRWHRGSGIVFTVSMLAMTSSAFVLAAFVHPNRLNVVAASLTFYLVATAYLAIRPVAGAQRAAAGLMLFAAILGTFAYSVGIDLVASDEAAIAPILFVFGSVALLGACLDARLAWGKSIQRVARLVRHLWRMTTAMLITTMSLFLGQPDLFPDPLRHRADLRAIPIVLVALLLFFWLGRFLIKRRRAIPRRVRTIGLESG